MSQTKPIIFPLNIHSPLILPHNCLHQKLCIVLALLIFPNVIHSFSLLVLLIFLLSVFKPIHSSLHQGYYSSVQYHLVSPKLLQHSLVLLNINLTSLAPVSSSGLTDITFPLVSGAPIILNFLCLHCTTLTLISGLCACSLWNIFLPSSPFCSDALK